MVVDCTGILLKSSNLYIPALTRQPCNETIYFLNITPVDWHHQFLFRHEICKPKHKIKFLVHFARFIFDIFIGSEEIAWKLMPSSSKCNSIFYYEMNFYSSSRSGWQNCPLQEEFGSFLETPILKLLPYCLICHGIIGLYKCLGYCGNRDAIFNFFKLYSHAVICCVWFIFRHM